MVWRIFAKECSFCGIQWRLCNGRPHGMINGLKNIILTAQNGQSPVSCVARNTSQLSCNNTTNCEPPYLYCNATKTSSLLYFKTILKRRKSVKQEDVHIFDSKNKLADFVKSDVHLCLYSVLNEPSLSNYAPPPPQLSSPSISNNNDNNNLPSPAQLSFVLLKLRDELPQFFSDHHSYQTLYHKDIRFENRLVSVPFSVRGHSNYRMCLSLLRHGLCAINSNVNLQLLKITKNVETGKIEARWRITGTPRYYLPWIVTRVLVEGFSTFTVDKSGTIVLHVMDKVMPVPKYKIWVQSIFIRLRGLVLKPAALQTHASTTNSTTFAKISS